MQLKHLNFCIIAVLLSACSTPVIKTNSQSSDLAQKSIQGINALYENASYNYRGQMQLGFDKILPSVTTTLQQQDVAVQNKLKQLLDQVKPALPLAEQRQLLQSVQQPKADMANHNMMNMVMTVLQDLSFAYDGTVHLDQKMASFNFTTDYNKANFKIQAKVAAVLDLKQQRIYTDYFGLTPFMVGPNAKSDWVYVDFSKFKQQLNQIDLKALVAYIKASGAVSYVLASPHQLQQVALDPAAQQAGAVEQIRHQAYVDEVLLQSLLFERVNRQYFLKQVLHLDNMMKSEDATPDDSPRIDLKASNSAQAEQAAKAVMHVKYRQQLKADDRADLTPTAALPATSHASSDAQVPRGTTTLANCERLKADSTSSHGQLQRCLNEHAQLLKVAQSKADNPWLNAAQFALVERFAAYDQGKFIDEKAFAALWQKHRAEIEAVTALPAQRSTMQINLALDAQGRLVAMRYDMVMPLPSLQRELQLKGDMWVSQYGKAPPIATQPLHDAIDMLEIAKKSSMSKWLGLTSDVKGNPKSTPAAPDLAQLTEQRYDQTQAYALTYQTVFLVKLAQQKPELLLRFSNNDLNEVGQVYAYWFSDESMYNPKDAELKRIEALQEKHQLLNEDQFDQRLGKAVDELVKNSQKSSADRMAWQKLQQQYRKQPAELFAQRYVALMLAQESDVSASEKADLQKVAQSLGQSYVLSRQNKPLDKVLNDLTSKQLEWLEQAIYVQSYEDVLQATTRR